MTRGRRPAAGSERSFGLSVGGVLVPIAAVLVWRGRVHAGEIAGVIGAVLIITGTLRPSLLSGPSRIWWQFARLLGHVNARIILTAAFVVVLTPMGLLWRAIGRDPLTRNRRAFPGWVPFPARYGARDHYQRMY